MSGSPWKSFVRWLKRALGFSADRPALKILEEYHADGISVLRIEDDSIPGCCELWRIDRQREQIKFFICIINTQSQREDLAGAGRTPVSQPRKPKLVDNIEQQIQEQKNILATHYWISGWSKRVHSVDAKGRAYQADRTYDLRLLACDLQGAAGAFAGDKHARRFARKIVKRLAANEFREYGHHRTWQAAVKSVDWQQWLQGLTQSHNGGIDPNHVLQPPKYRKRSSRRG
ncbi:hypothetical protein IFO70_10315 [Phormidium tenue FACHB-886]|nr:hypothetical protein [Phormidium tenue FACHB-886]